MLIPKANFIRDKAFRKWLSERPCAKCKIEGHSQAAHIGKGGKGIKGGDDTCLSLCCERLGVLGCHKGLDLHLEPHYWNENLARALATARQVYEHWKAGRFEQAERLIREF